MRKLLVLPLVVLGIACSSEPSPDASPVPDAEVAAWTSAARPIFESQNAIVNDATAITDIHTPAVVWKDLSDRWMVTVNQQERLPYPPSGCLKQASERWLASSD